MRSRQSRKRERARAPSAAPAGGAGLAAVLVEQPLAERLGERVGVGVAAQPARRPCQDRVGGQPRYLLEQVVAVVSHGGELLEHPGAAGKIAVDIGCRDMDVREQPWALLR